MARPVNVQGIQCVSSGGQGDLDAFRLFFDGLEGVSCGSGVGQECILSVFAVKAPSLVLIKQDQVIKLATQLKLGL